MRARLILPGRVRRIGEIRDYHTIVDRDGRPVLRARFLVNKRGSIYEYDVPVGQLAIEWGR